MRNMLHITVYLKSMRKLTQATAIPQFYDISFKK